MGQHKDPHGVYDSEAGKWRLLLAEKAGKFRASMWESDHWDRDYQRLAGPVEMDSIGTRIWPNIIPLPDGYPAPYIALMMDRINYPDMPTPNWTYGAMYLFLAQP